MCVLMSNGQCMNIYIYIRYRFIVKLCPSTVPAQLYEQDTSIHTHEIQIQDNFFFKVYSQWQNRIKYFIYICLRNNWLGLLLLNIFDITWNFNQKVLLFCNILNNEKQIYHYLSLFFFKFCKFNRIILVH